MAKPTGRAVNHACAVLREHGIAPSYHRTRIFESLLGRKDHPTAETVYRDISPDIPTLSRTTVYNTLNLLVEKRLALALSIEGNETRFDGDVNPHPHFKCAACRRVIDVAHPCEMLREKRVEGHRVASVDVFFKGTCAACLAR